MCVCVGGGGDRCTTSKEVYGSEVDNSEDCTSVSYPGRKTRELRIIYNKKLCYKSIVSLRYKCVCIRYVHMFICLK